MSHRAVELATEDYERIFAVLESCEDATELTEFRRSVAGAVKDVFGLEAVTFFYGPTLAKAFADARPIIIGGPAVATFESYRRWRREDVFATPEALHRLAVTGSVCLTDLVPLPESSAAYVHFLHATGMQSCNAFAFPMGRAGHALIGVFDPNPVALMPHDALAMRVLCRRLRVISRALAPDVCRRSPLDDLTKRQRDVVERLAQGLSNAEIGADLFLTEDTVKKYVSRVLSITRCRSRTELAVLAIRS